jgi:PAS domain S-box-containing protein
MEQKTQTDHGSRKRILQIATDVSATIGADFFRSMVKHLAQALGADTVYIGEFVGGPDERVRTLAAYVDGNLDGAFDYLLAGSASAGVALGNPCLCRSNAQTRFPSDPILQEVRAHSCVGIPLVDAQRQPIGLLMAMYRHPLASLGVPKSMLEIFAPRASAELDRKHTEERILESEQRYKAFIAQNADGMWRLEFEQPVRTDLPVQEQIDRIDRYGYVAECNDAAARQCGLEKAEQLIGWRVGEILPHQNASMRDAAVALIRSGYRFSTVEVMPLDREGNPRYVMRTAWGVVENGVLQRIWGTTRDITELKRSERALDASEQRMADLLEAVNVAVAVLDLQGSVVFCNQYLLKLTGWHTEDIVGKNWFDLMIPAEERARLRSGFASAKLTPQNPYRFESTLLGQDGRRFWIAWDSAILRDSEGKPAASANVGRDITEHKALEAQFRQAQKLESIGKLAGGVAHDFNNLLTVIGGYAAVLLEKRDPADPAYIGLAEIRKAAEKGAGLTNQLLAFSRRQVLRPQVLNLNALIAEDERMLRRLIGADIELVTNLDGALGLVRADAGNIHQVLLNLSVNARDAMPKGGKLIIATSNVDMDGISVPGTPPGEYVQLTVTDTGSGMTEEVRSHLFEPFFTTKEQGKGTGLGLSTVYGIVRQSGGHISVESAPGKGASFRILLPRIQAAAPGVEQASEAVLKGGTETILLVEDCAEVRSLAAKILRDLGYTVMEAESPSQALELTQTAGGKIRLILTDLVLPGMGGSELADLIKAVQKNIRVVFMSGYSDMPYIQEKISQPGFAYLQKPFTTEALTKTVREILDQR